MGKLDNKTAIITGGSNGMGANHVKSFIEEGANVVFTDVDDNSGQTLAQSLGAQAKFIKHDVTQADEWDKLVKATEETFGPVDILVNNAGINYSGPLETFPEHEYKKVIEVNQTGVFLGMKAVIPSMKKTEAGSIINISSIGGVRGRLNGIAYGASKFAVTGMTKTAALELGAYNIRVNSVHPSLVDTGLFGDVSGASVNMDARPLKRMLEKDEVSQAIIHLASSESSYTTGAEYIIDGGLTSK